MQFTTIAALFLSSALLVSAVPTPTEEHVARSCKTAFPDFARVEEARPAESYLPGFIIAQDHGNQNNRDVFAEFKIPPNSYGCQLEAVFPSGFPIAQSGSSQVNVFSVAAPLSRSPHGIDISWAYSPAPISLIGTLTFGSATDKPTRTVINSFTCASALAYRFRIANDWAAGSVQFDQQPGAGLRMTYNC